MSKYLKRAWITQAHESRDPDHSLYTLTLESERVDLDYARLHAVGMLFPEVPTPEHPLRHTLALRSLSLEDIRQLHHALACFLITEGKQ